MVLDNITGTNITSLLKFILTEEDEAKLIKDIINEASL